MKSLQRYRLKDNLELLVLAIPCLIYFFIWHYLPMSGLVLAFKNYNHVGGVFGSPWNGLKNFTFLFSSQVAWRLIRNTVGYALAIIVVGNIAAMLVALFMFDVRSRRATKFYQTTMIIPRFLSWVIVGYVTYTILSPTQGIANQILKGLGLEGVSWYTEPKYWPFIIVFSEVWKTIGLNSIMYYAALMAIDPNLFEAAEIDGASNWQKKMSISFPSLTPLITILVLLALGRIFRGDFGLFYQIPRDVGILYPATDIIDTYVYRGLRAGNFSISTAVGLFQSVAGLLMVLFSNWVVRKFDPERSLF